MSKFIVTKVLGLAIVPFAFIGCTKMTFLEPEAKIVKIVLEEPKKCENLGEVEGYKKQSGNLSLKQMKESAQNDLRNNTYEMGGNAVLILNRDSGSGGGGTYSLVGGGIASSSQYTAEYHIEGRAYKCP